MPGVPLTARETLQNELLAWFAENGRDLPWRRTRDPYAILVSEVMLQQTQVARVLERYPQWLERWPTAAALAAAPAADVLRAWSGLGYNRRALNLQNAARRVVELGEFPRAIDELERLPGIGPYTARAIACFAFDAQVTALDTNVRRVLERSLGTSTPSRRRAAPGTGTRRSSTSAHRSVSLGCHAARPARWLPRAPRAGRRSRRCAVRAASRARAGSVARRSCGSSQVARAQTAATIGRWSTLWSPTASPCAERTAC